MGTNSTIYNHKIGRLFFRIPIPKYGLVNTYFFYTSSQLLILPRGAMFTELIQPG